MSLRASTTSPSLSGRARTSPARTSRQVSGPGQLERAADVQAQGERLAGLDPAPALAHVEAPADAGIDRLADGSVGRLAGVGDLHPDAPAGAEARIEHAEAIELAERLIVQVHPVRLAHHRAVPIEAEPTQILAYPLLELGPAALAIDVLHAQEEAPAHRPGRLPGD